MHPLKKFSRGFAFVEFDTKIMCRKAIKGLNATSFKGRTIIVDMSVSKDKFLKMLKERNQQALHYCVTRFHMSYEYIFKTNLSFLFSKIF